MKSWLSVRFREHHPAWLSNEITNEPQTGAIFCHFVGISYSKVEHKTFDILYYVPYNKTRFDKYRSLADVEVA